MVKKTKNNSCPSKKMVVNKGAWTAEEDEKLADYVKIHGDKKWRSLPAKAGLNRHGKSCRLRWLNYLRPGIKRGNISEEEEDLIIRLHNLLGNRWSLIAGRLPGRTDNEIKNHWNTHLSKKTLTINELNLKLNQKHETRSYCSSTSLTFGSNSPVAPEVDWPKNVHQNKKSIGSQDSEIVSKPWSEVLKRNELLGDDFDVDKFFDFSSVSDLADCELDSDDQIGAYEHNLNDHGVYQGLLSAELQGTDRECLDQHIMFNQLDFGKLTRLLECDY